MTQARVGSEVLNPNRLYTILVPDFIATGGSGFAELKIPPKRIKVLEDLPVMRDMVAKIWSKWSGPTDARSYYDPQNPRQKIKTSCDLVHTGAE